MLVCFVLQQVWNTPERSVVRLLIKFVFQYIWNTVKSSKSSGLSQSVRAFFLLLFPHLFCFMEWVLCSGGEMAQKRALLLLLLLFCRIHVAVHLSFSVGRYMTALEDKNSIKVGLWFSRGLKQKNMNPVQIVFFAVGNYSGRVRYWDILNLLSITHGAVCLKPKKMKVNKQGR